MKDTVTTIEFTALETPRLMLRHFTDNDLPYLLAYRNDPVVAQYQAWEAVLEEQIRHLILEMEQARPGVPGAWFQIAIVLKTTGELIGDCGLRTDSRDVRQAEIGFTLSRAFWGQGLAREAIQHVLDYAFGTLNMRRIIAISDCENVRSIALMKQLGMRFEGHFVQSTWSKGRWRDEYQYAILQSEWQRQPAPA